MTLTSTSRWSDFFGAHHTTRPCLVAWPELNFTDGNVAPFEIDGIPACCIREPGNWLRLVANLENHRVGWSLNQLLRLQDELQFNLRFALEREQLVVCADVPADDDPLLACARDNLTMAIRNLVASEPPPVHALAEDANALLAPITSVFEELGWTEHVVCRTNAWEIQLPISEGHVAPVQLTLDQDGWRLSTMVASLFTESQPSVAAEALRRNAVTRMARFSQHAEDLVVECRLPRLPLLGHRLRAAALGVTITYLKHRAPLLVLARDPTVAKAYAEHAMPVDFSDSVSSPL